MALTLIYATDLHGSIRSYGRLAELACSLRPTAVILGGDLTSGHTPAEQKAFIREQLAPRLRRFHQQHPETIICGLMGNDDWQSCEGEMAILEKEGVWQPLHLRARQLPDGHWIAGCSFVPVTPFGISDWDRLDLPDSHPPMKRAGPLLSSGDQVRQVSMDELLARPCLQECLTPLLEMSDPGRTIYVMHSPPFGTALDVVGSSENVGSKAVRLFIERHQPPLTLHGHIHESREMSGKIADKLGRTIMLNPGASAFTLRAISIIIDKEKVEWKLM